MKSVVGARRAWACVVLLASGLVSEIRAEGEAERTASADLEAALSAYIASGRPVASAG